MSIFPMRKEYKKNVILIKINNKVLFYILIFTSIITILWATTVVLAQSTSSIIEDPFNYTGKCMLSEGKLTIAENAALVYVQKYATQYGISPSLIMAFIKQESTFNPTAIGDGGLAIGYM